MLDCMVCELSELIENKPIAFELDGTEVGVILSNGQLYAYENHCPHFGGPVCLGDVFPRIKLKLNHSQMAIGEYVDEGDLRLVCPWHAYEFELTTGTCTVDPKLSLNKLQVYIKDDCVYLSIGENKGR